VASLQGSRDHPSSLSGSSCYSPLLAPSGKHTKSDIENGPIEIVDLPIKIGESFHSYVNVYQRVNP
jgi:hypothetical protein